MYEIHNNNGDEKSKESDPDDSAIFCERKQILYSIFTVIFLSLVLGFPQIFAYDVTENIINVSPSSIPTYINSENSKTFENVYFIQEEVEEDQFPELIFKTTTTNLYNEKTTQTSLKLDFSQKIQTISNFSYSTNVAKAYGITIDMNLQHYNILAKLKNTHSRFFSINGIYNFASKRYQLCNTLQNSNRYEKPKKYTDPSINFTLSTLDDILLVNVTLICIRKSDLNSYLAYNTLYFWLEHTMVISVPICIIIVVLIPLILIFVKVFKFMLQQKHIRKKRKRINKILSQMISLNNQEKLTKRFIKTNNKCDNFNDNLKYEEITASTITPSTPQTPRTAIKQKTVQIQDTEELDTDLETELYFLGIYVNETGEYTTYEKDIRRKQNDYQNLNLMFIIDLILFVLISFPYTIMRLVLDLFVKDRIKISLDFFILYKFTLLLFHFHLILKFFLWVTLNVKFRVSLAQAFAFRPSYCCVEDYDKIIANNPNFNSRNKKNNQNNLANFSSNNLDIDDYNDKSMFKRFLFCCFNLDYENNIDFNENISSLSNNFDGDELNEYHSTEFNSSLHQYSCPADPDEDDTIKFKTKKKPI